MSRGLVFIVIGITLLPMMLGTNGIWMTVPVAELLTAVVAAVLLRRLFRKLV